MRDFAAKAKIPDRRVRETRGWMEGRDEVDLAHRRRAGHLFDKEKFEGKKLVVEGSLYDLGDFRGRPHP